jgi:hypothetical protein
MIPQANSNRKSSARGIRYDGPCVRGLHAWTDLETHGSFTTEGKDIVAATKTAMRVREEFRLFALARATNAFENS